MNNAASLDRLVADFHAAGRPRVWSLVITIFGDAVEPRGGRISALRLRAVLGRLGVEPGALRTALSRLVKEDWVIRERQGRASFYRLSPSGQTAFGPATDWIFRPATKPENTDAMLGVLVGGSVDRRAALDRQVVQRRGRVLATGAYLWTGAERPDSNWLSKQGIVSIKGPMAGASERIACLPELKAQRRDCDSLLASFAPFQTVRPEAMMPLDAFALRVMLVHFWRRIVLRYPDLPQALTPENWPGQACHELVVDLYKALLMPSENWLDQSTGMEALPPPNSGFFQRFGGLDQSSR